MSYTRAAPSSRVSQGLKRSRQPEMASPGSFANPINLSDDDADNAFVARPMKKIKSSMDSTRRSSTATSRKKSIKSETVAAPEKRERKYRDHPPISYIERRQRALSQRLFLLGRERRLSAEGTHEEEVFDMAGTTGNIYKVTISKQPKCTCPDQTRNRLICKHIIYVLVNVLKAPPHLQYQLALLSNELADIFANAPASPQSSDGSKADTSNGGKRKPIEGDCPICVTEFEAGEEIVWCKAACGNNIHKACFEQWAKSRPGEVTCVYCRQPWKADDKDLKSIARSAKKNKEGYVNVASQLGLSGRRDTSTYYDGYGYSRRGYSRYGYEDDYDYED